MKKTLTIVSTVAWMFAAGAADAANAARMRFSTSFEAGQPAPATLAGEGLKVTPGSGPERPYAAKKNAAYTGAQALHYRAEGPGGRLRLWEVDIEVKPDTVLSWMVLPEIVDGDIDTSTHVSLDLVLDDGRRVSGLDLRDHHGVRLGALAQGQSKTLYPQQWARKAVRLGALEGRRIKAIELELRPSARGGASGWIDDIVVAEQAPARVARLSDHVLTTRGTQANGTFSRGNNIPATAMPHGFNFWTPATDAGTLNWLYRWNEQNDANNRPRLQALSLSHQPSPWMADRQTFQVMPSGAQGRPDADRQRRALPFSHDRELARPYTYRVDFDNGIRAELAPTERAAIFRFQFPNNVDANLLFDNVDNRGGLTLDAATQTLRGFTDTRSGLSNGATRMFVFARFDQRWQDSGAIETGRPTGYIKFKPDNGEVRMRIATSLISVEQAQRNLELELGDAGFDTVRERAQAAWDKELERVRVEGASADQLTTVYSNLYRLFLYPNVAHENVGTAARPEWRHADQSSWSKDKAGGDVTKTSAPVLPGKVHVNNGFWDTFRTTWPAYSLLAPQRTGEMIDGFLQQYRDGGWVARWSSPGYADLMVGTSSDVAFADAWLKGVRGFDAHQAYEAALKNATAVPPVPNVGRKGLARSMYRGYADTSVHEGMSWTLEGALNDFGLAQLATALANEEGKDSARGRRYRDEAAYFRARAADYVHVYDPATGFFRGRDAQGQWRVPAREFEPRRWGGDYTEANAWTFAFTAPHDAEGLASLMGGRHALAGRLDAFFATHETAEAKFAGSYRQVIHEMTEARDVRMGMYAHSNQPAHHIPWMYVAAGQPWKTQRITREALRRLYLGSEIGQGYAGDEDNGEMSAWYTFAMLGLYPLRMGSPEYVIGSPAFARTEMKLENGRTLTVIAHGNGPDNVYVQSLEVDGRPWNKAWIRHADIADGATLEFTMGSQPSNWGSETKALPASMTAAGRRPAGLLDRSKGATLTLDGKGADGALVDDDAATTATLPARASIGFALAKPATVSYYTITGGKAPLGKVSWTLEGRDDNGGWVALDRREDEAFDWERQLRPFGVAAPGTYREYRLRFAQDAAFELGELELLEAGRADSGAISVY